MSRHFISDVWWHVQRRGDVSARTLVLLHGFAGSMVTWDPLLPELVKHFRVLLIDLPGHGRTSLPRSPQYSIETLINGLTRLIHAAASTPVLLCGYSMGGRLALQLALNRPRLIRGLALIGASPGIEDSRAREERRQTDDLLADQIITRGVRWFADYWANLPLFDSQKRLPPATRDQIRAQRLTCTADGLAFALRKFGTGVQENLWPRLYGIEFPLLLMAGGLDHKFQESNQRISMRVASSILTNCVVADCGHAVQTENPRSVLQALTDFDQAITRAERS